MGCERPPRRYLKLNGTVWALCDLGLESRQPYRLDPRRQRRNFRCVGEAKMRPHAHMSALRHSAHSRHLGRSCCRRGLAGWEVCQFTGARLRCNWPNDKVPRHHGKTQRTLTKTSFPVTIVCAPLASYPCSILRVVSTTISAPSNAGVLACR